MRVEPEFREKIDEEAERREQNRSDFVRETLQSEIEESREERSRALEAARRATYIVGALFVLTVVVLDATGAAVIGAGVALLVAMLATELLTLREASLIGGLPKIVGR